MKKVNLTIVATIITTFVISMFAFQPTKTEASNNVLPSATPSPRRIKPKKPTGFDPYLEIEGVKAKKPTNNKSGASSGGNRRKQPHQTSAQYNPKEIGIDKVARRKASGSSGTRPTKNTTTTSQRLIKRNRTESVNKDETITINQKTATSENQINTNQTQNRRRKILRRKKP